jgi:hypothetical protein
VIVHRRFPDLRAGGGIEGVDMPARSPMNARKRGPLRVDTRPMLTAARTAEAAWKNQCTQPVAALSEYTTPL